MSDAILIAFMTYGVYWDGFFKACLRFDDLTTNLEDVGVLFMR